MGDKNIKDCHLLITCLRSNANTKPSFGVSMMLVRFYTIYLELSLRNPVSKKSMFTKIKQDSESKIDIL